MQELQQRHARSTPACVWCGLQQGERAKQKQMRSSSPPCAVVNFGAKSPPSQRQQRGQFQNWNRFSFVFALNVLQLWHFLTRLLTVPVTCHLSSIDIDRRCAFHPARPAMQPMCGPAFITKNPTCCAGCCRCRVVPHVVSCMRRAPPPPWLCSMQRLPHLQLLCVKWLRIFVSSDKQLGLA